MCLQNVDNISLVIGIDSAGRILLTKLNESISQGNLTKLNVTPVKPAWRVVNELYSRQHIARKVSQKNKGIQFSPYLWSVPGKRNSLFEHRYNTSYVKPVNEVFSCKEINVNKVAKQRYGWKQGNRLMEKYLFRCSKFLQILSRLHERVFSINDNGVWHLFLRFEVI